MSVPPNYPEKQPYSDSSSAPMLPLPSAPYPPYPTSSFDQGKIPYSYEQLGQTFPTAQNNSYSQGQMPMMAPNQAPNPTSYSPNMQKFPPHPMEFQQPIQQQPMVNDQQQTSFVISSESQPEFLGSGRAVAVDKGLGCFDKMIICLVRRSYDMNEPPSASEKCGGCCCICVITIVCLPLLLNFILYILLKT